MTVKAIFSECSNPVWPDVATRLNQESGWEPCYWIASLDFEQSVKKRFPDAVFHSNLDTIRGIGAPDCADLKLAALDQPLLEDLSFCESIALQMMNRMDPGDSFSYEERVRLYHTHVRYWIAVLNHFNPDVVIFPISPHVVYDYVLYVLCKKRGIKTIMFEQTSLEGLIYPVENFEQGSNSIKLMYKTLISSINNMNAQDVTLSKTAENYLRRISGDYSNAIPFYLKNRLKKDQKFNLIDKLVRGVKKPHLVFNLVFNMIQNSLKGWRKAPRNYLKQKGKKIEDSHMTGWGYKLYKYKSKKKKEWLNRYYNKLAQDVDFARPYIYVPLHYQPERTSSPLGEVFANQFLMVDLLSKCVPEGWDVYVREHPVQLRADSHGERSRTIDFYDDIASLHNVKIIPVSISSFDLIDHSKAVATVTGTVGWEAVLRGKPVLMFGHAWYKDCEGVFYTPTEEMCRAILSEINAGYKVDNKFVRLFVYVLEQVCVRGYVESAYEKVTGISYEENVLALTDAIQKTFYNKESKNDKRRHSNND